MRESSIVGKHEEQWETVVDFTTIKMGGTPVDDILERLQKKGGAHRSYAVRRVDE